MLHITTVMRIMEALEWESVKIKYDDISVNQRPVASHWLTKKKN